MPITEQNIVRHELIGLDIEAAKSKDKGIIPSKLGKLFGASPKMGKISGAIIDETKKMLKIRTKEGEKLVEKSTCTFRISLPSGKKVEVDGRLLVGRPEERIKKKLLKKWDFSTEG